MKTQTRLPIAIALAAAVLFAAATPASKAMLDQIPPFQLAGLLYLGAAVGMIPQILSERTFSAPWSIDKKTAGRLVGAILFGGIIGPVLVLLGLRLASSASVAMWLNLELVATVLLGWMFFRDQLTGYGWLASLGMLAASILLAVSEPRAGFRAGLLVAGACVCWGLDNHLTALIDGIPPSQTTFWKGIVAGTTNLAIGLTVSGMSAPIAVAGAALLVGGLSYGISIFLYISAAQKLGASRSQIIFSSSPFFAVLMSALFLGESISRAQLSAALIILISLVFLFLEKHAHVHTHKAEVHDHWHSHEDPHHNHPHPDSPRVLWHSHRHTHRETRHAHPHWPDINHRHRH